jgi:drug/metabolite transporter (DMT)-like permease
MLWIVIALIAPASWAIGNHIDKYLIDTQHDNGGIPQLLLYSAFIGLPALILIGLFQPNVLQISVWHGTILTANGMLYVLGLIPYFYALEQEEASVVIPLFQLTAVFSYFLGLFILDEQLGWEQIAASLLIIFGSVFVTLEADPKRFRVRFSVFLWMLLASFLNALNWLLFKVVAIEEAFWRTSFWEYVGFVIVAVGLLIIPGYRHTFIQAIRIKSPTVLAFVTLNEVLGLIAKTATNFASLLAPLALVSVLNGLQPLFVFVLGILLTLYVPTYTKEMLDRHNVFRKLIAMIIMVIGTSWLAISS